jgi:hypothetical protein
MFTRDAAGRLVEGALLLLVLGVGRLFVPANVLLQHLCRNVVALEITLHSITKVESTGGQESHHRTGEHHRVEGLLLETDGGTGQEATTHVVISIVLVSDAL